MNGIEETHNNEEEGLINFTKMRLIWQIAKEMKTYQEGSFNITKNEKLFSFFQNIPILDEKTLFSLSTKFEPKDGEKEVVRSNPLKVEREQLQRRGSKDRREESIGSSGSSRRGSGDSFDSQTEFNYRKNDDDEEEKLTEKHFADLEATLSHSKSCEAFEKYLESVGSKQLLDFLNEVELFKILEEPVQLQEKASYLYVSYFGSSQTKKITIDEDLLQQIKEKLNHRIFSPDIFNMAQAAVFINLNAIFPAFKKSVFVKVALDSANANSN